MKKINIFIVLGVFVLLLIGLTQSAYAEAWDYVNNPTNVDAFGYTNNPSLFKISFGCCASEAAHLNAAMAKSNGLLNAYSVNQKQNTEKQLFTAASDLSSSLEKFNTALMEVYPTLSEEEQLAVREAYSSLGLYLEDLAVRTNAVFGREVFRIVKEVEPKGIDSVQTFGLVLGPGQ